MGIGFMDYGYDFFFIVELKLTSFLFKISESVCEMKKMEGKQVNISKRGLSKLN